MKRPTKGYSGQEVTLFPTMLDVSAPSTSPSRITSSPSHSPSPSPEPSTQHSPNNTTAAASLPSPTKLSPTQPSPTKQSPTQQSPTQQSPTQPSPGVEHHFPTPHDSPLHVVHSHGSDEGSLKLDELTNLVTKLSDRIEKARDAKSNTWGKQGEKLGIVQLSDEEDIEDYFLPNRGGSVLPPVITEVEITLAQTLAELKSAKSKVMIQEPVQSTVTTAPLTIPKPKGITFRDAGETTTRTPTSVYSSSIKDKGKAKMVEPEVPLNKKDQIRLDKDLVKRLDAKEQEAARLERENVELQEQATLAKIKEWDNVASHDGC
ncbi:hypothetical protein Tco_1518071 [Tanacetum coccineum]